MPSGVDLYLLFKHTGFSKLLKHLPHCNHQPCNYHLFIVSVYKNKNAIKKKNIFFIYLCFFLQAEKGSQPCDPDNVDGHPCFGPFTTNDEEENPMFFCGEYDDFGAESIERCRPERDSSSSSSSTEDVTGEEEAAGGEGEGEEAGGPDGGEMGGEQPPP